MRESWAKQMSKLIKPGGELLTLVYPVNKETDPKKEGPPFPVTPEIYKELLLSNGFECVYLERVPEHLSHPDRVEREYFGRWRRLANPN